jgi:hypothetical protein
MAPKPDRLPVELYSELRDDEHECARLPRLYLHGDGMAVTGMLPIGTHWSCPDCGLLWTVVKIAVNGLFSPETRWMTTGPAGGADV